MTENEKMIINELSLDYDENGNWILGGWIIEQVGGHITNKRWQATKGEQYLWFETRKGLLNLIWQIEHKLPVNKIFLKPLY